MMIAAQSLDVIVVSKVWTPAPVVVFFEWASCIDVLPVPLSAVRIVFASHVPFVVSASLVAPLDRASIATATTTRAPLATEFDATETAVPVPEAVTSWVSTPVNPAYASAVAAFAETFGDHAKVIVSLVWIAVVTFVHAMNAQAPALTLPGSASAAVSVVQVFDRVSVTVRVGAAPLVPELSAATLTTTRSPTDAPAVVVRAVDASEAGTAVTVPMFATSHSSFVTWIVSGFRVTSTLSFQCSVTSTVWLSWTSTVTLGVLGPVANDKDRSFSRNASFSALVAECVSMTSGGDVPGEQPRGCVLDGERPVVGRVVGTEVDQADRVVASKGIRIQQCTTSIGDCR
jgi:hypothetical protein